MGAASAPMIVLLVAQLAAAVPADERFDLRSALHPPVCPPAENGETVVCARKRDSDRERLQGTVGPMPDFTDKPLRAETGILGGKASLGVVGETVTIGGAPSNRAMIRLKTKF